MSINTLKFHWYFTMGRGTPQYSISPHPLTSLAAHLGAQNVAYGN